MEPVRPDDEAVAAFARDGVACLRSVLTPPRWRSRPPRSTRCWPGPGRWPRWPVRPVIPGAFTEDFCRWREIGEIERLARHSRVPALAAALMATPRVRFYHDHVLREGGRDPAAHAVAPGPAVLQRGRPGRQRVDPGGPGARGRLPGASVAGTHRGPWLMPRTFLKKEARWFPEGSLAELPDIDADPAGFDIRRFGLRPGDAIFFDFLTVHGAPGFPRPGRRRILSLRYLSADVRHAPAPGAPRRRSTTWTPSSRSARTWTTPCSRWSG